MTLWTRPCACGCGEIVRSKSNEAKQLTRECRRRRQTERQLIARKKERDSRTNLTAREVSPHPVRLNTDPAHKPSKVCRVCFNLPERRAETCPGCGQHWAAERAGVARIVLSSSSGLALGA